MAVDKAVSLKEQVKEHVFGDSQNIVIPLQLNRIIVEGWPVRPSSECPSEHVYVF